MSKLLSAMLNLQELEVHARSDNPLTRMHPVIKVIITLIYILAMTSLGKYELSRALLFGVLPILFINLADIPYSVIAKKLMIPLLFGISLGLFNPLYDQSTYVTFGSIPISGGFISLFTIVIKALFSISMTLLLVSVTTIEAIGSAMSMLKVPKLIIVLLLIMYRYIIVFLDEIEKTLEAYSLRVNNKRGLHISTWGSLMGQIILRSYHRSEVLFEAMQLRGFDSMYRMKKVKPLSTSDMLAMISCSVIILVLRFIP